MADGLPTQLTKKGVPVQFSFIACSVLFYISCLDVASPGCGELCKHCVFTLAFAPD